MSEDDLSATFAALADPVRRAILTRLQAGVGLVTTTFEELDGGRSRLTEVSLFPSFEDRDGVVASGMEGGARESMDRLDELLARS